MFDLTTRFCGSRLLLTRLPRWLIGAIVLVVFVSAAALAAIIELSRSPPSWRMIDQWIEYRFPEVQHIDTAALSALLRDEANPISKNEIVLIDTRELNEFNVSRIKGAYHFSPKSMGRNVGMLKEKIRLDRPLVVYCSIGVRSAEVATALQDAGFTDVQNLRGSIFRWANEGRPLEGGNKVHPFNAYWGQLLDGHLHAELD